MTFVRRLTDGVPPRALWALAILLAVLLAAPAVPLALWSALLAMLVTPVAPSAGARRSRRLAPRA